MGLTSCQGQDAARRGERSQPAGKAGQFFRAKRRALNVGPSPVIGLCGRTIEDAVEKASKPLGRESAESIRRQAMRL
jgi:hypothetical protein